MQLSLPVSLVDNETFDTFYEEGNEHLVEHLLGFLNENMLSVQKPLFYLHGTSGAGKSHLLYSACHALRSQNEDVMYLDMAEIKAMPTQVIDGMVSNSLVCIDNIDAISGSKEWEVAIFDLINQALEGAKCRIIIAGQASPTVIGLTLPDLISRLSWGIVFQLAKHSDDVLLRILARRLSERGLKINDESLRFILSRSERKLTTLMSLVIELDEKSLQAKRKLTIPFIKEALSL
ncbi:DnaA regulatory inactivator Hda [Glaciecola sp. MH2013]|uniref:DnaA regulatory inactivator Hda n=1 Tax=Glaciecola sp. MH2013 TaxID=2785524 RepID=UPI00189E89E4|nr:DnaA regulatory inactivator Hda [Glaciecola sp. MH2013]MBF7072881.1 DnaA regulatory inactivator Hda [Glaciecola sp. MH2013]